MNLIDTYRSDISKLIQMKKLHESTINLCGGFASDIIREIDDQIKHCKNCIENLKPYHAQKE